MFHDAVEFLKAYRGIKFDAGVVDELLDFIAVYPSGSTVRINLTLSLALVSRFELVGVAIGTACAVAVRCIYNVIYLSKNVLNRPVKKFIRLISVDAGIAASSIMLCKLLFSYDIVGWGDWIVRGIVTFAVTLVVAIAFSMLFYRDELKQTWMLLMRVAKNRS